MTKYQIHGLNKRKYANAVSDLADQVRWIEQRISMSVDNTISQNYRMQQKDIKRTRSSLIKLTKQNKQNKNVGLPTFTNKVKKRLS